MPALRQPGGHELLRPEAVALGAHDHPVPRARRVAHAELAQHLLAEPATREVAARVLGLFRLPQIGGVEARGALEQREQALAPAAALLGARVLVLALELHAVALGEELHGLGEVERLGVAHERDRVALGLAAEAVVELVLAVDRERRRALVVEGAQAHPARAHSPQVGLGAHQGDHVHGLAHALDRVVGVERHTP